MQSHITSLTCALIIVISNWPRFQGIFISLPPPIVQDALVSMFHLEPLQPWHCSKRSQAAECSENPHRSHPTHPKVFTNLIATRELKVNERKQRINITENAWKNNNLQQHIVREVVKKRIFSGQADRKCPPPSYGQFFCEFFLVYFLS